MKILKSVKLTLANVDPSMNVITVCGRSGIEYQFIWDPEVGAHARAYGDFDKEGEIERLEAEGIDLSEAVMPPGWVVQRRFGFEQASPEATTGQGGECGRCKEFAELLRRAILRLLKRIDPEAAKAAFSGEEMEMTDYLLQEPAEKALAEFGITIPSAAWMAAMAKSRLAGGAESSEEAGASRTACVPKLELGNESAGRSAPGPASPATPSTGSGPTAMPGQRGNPSGGTPSGAGGTPALPGGGTAQAPGGNELQKAGVRPGAASPRATSRQGLSHKRKAAAG